LVFAPASLILTNYFLPLNEALGKRSNNLQYQESEKILKELKARVKKYNTNLNESGIWLFLATLGCWSVKGVWLPYIAVGATFIIFTHKLVTGLDGFKTFTSELDSLKTKVENSDLDDKSKKAIKFDILEFNRLHLSYKRIILHVPAYYLSMIFLMASMNDWWGPIA